MMTEIIKELATVKKTNEVTSEQVYSWTKGVEVQRAHKVTLDTNKESMAFGMIKKVKQSCDEINNP